MCRAVWVKDAPGSLPGKEHVDVGSDEAHMPWTRNKLPFQSRIKRVDEADENKKGDHQGHAVTAGARFGVLKCGKEQRGKHDERRFLREHTGRKACTAASEAPE